MVLNEQEKTLRKYLLGELSEHEQETLELWLMSEAEAYDLVASAENDLIDELVGGKLSPHELERFNNHFLVAPERKRKLRFGQAFHRYIDATRDVVPVQVPTKAFTFRDLFRYRPVFAYAASALIVLLLGSGLWAGLQFQDMHEQLSAAQVQLALDREEFKRQLDASQAQGERLQSDFHVLEQAVTNVKSSPSAEVLVALVLMPGRSRTAADVQELDLTSNAQLAELSLTLLDDDYESYQAVLVDENGKELWTRDRLSPKTTGESKVIILMVPASRFSSGDLSVRLSGRSGSNLPEDIASYRFHAKR